MPQGIEILEKKVVEGVNTVSYSIWWVLLVVVDELSLQTAT